jgi:hypothetical protein
MPQWPKIATLSLWGLLGLGLAACVNSPPSVPQAQQLSDLNAIKQKFEHDETRVDVLTPPDNWWGWAAGLHGSEQGKISSIYAGKDGHLYVFELWGKEAGYGAAIVDVFEGRVAVSTREQPDLGKNAPQDTVIEANLGLERISPALFASSPPLQNSGYRLQCGRPNVSRLSPRSSEIGIYLYKFLAAPITEDGGNFCDESWSGYDDPADRTLDYQSLGGTVYRPLRDGTLLLVVEQQWIVRLRTDLTSPFFAGRRDIIRADSPAIDAIVKRHNISQRGQAAAAIKEVREFLLQRAESQAAGH